MSEAATSNKNAVQPALLNNVRESAVHRSSQVSDVSPAAEGVGAVSEREMSPSIQAAEPSPNEPKPTFDYDEEIIGDQGAAPVVENSASPSIHAAATSLKEESEQPTAVKGKNSDDAIENLMALFRDFLEAAPNPTTSDHTPTQENRAERKRKFFGLNKGLSPGTSSNNKYDYEQKYPRDQLGEEAADNARVWLTYLDEAEAFDRERVEGWKETVDVLLVFAGLFSGVITTFISQASQSLQRDNTQVSASLLFEIAQLLRAQSSGTPINNIPNSMLTPTSRFTPSTNAFWVNGLWFTSLAITLSTALFAVLAKQWLYYYISSITGTAHEKARARQLRFKGFEMWKVGAIVDLLPILLHLAVGIFLMGIIILLFPLDIRVAWTIVVITGGTCFLYFISVILPIRYPECPYTTSLTIYVGVLVFFLQKILKWISKTLKKGFQAIWGIINSDTRYTIRRLFHYAQGLFRHAFSFIMRLVGFIRRDFRRFQDTIFTEELPKFTNWREENIKKAVKNAISLDFEALNWLYTTSPNRSVRRIIARSVAVHPIIGHKFSGDIRENLSQALEVSETNVVDLRYGLCLDLHDRYYGSWGDTSRPWRLLRSIPDVEESRLEEEEYRSYSQVAENVIDVRYGEILAEDGAVHGDLKLPLVMWRHFFKEASVDVTVVEHILTHGLDGLLLKSTCDTGLVSFRSKELGQWKFQYLYRYFFPDTQPDYSPDDFETRYLLLITIYCNLTSDQPVSVIADVEQRQESLFLLFHNFRYWLDTKPRVSPKQYIAFFIDICCVDAFWSEFMKVDGRWAATSCLYSLWKSMDTDVANRFPFTECDDLSPMYQWCSRRDLESENSSPTTPIFTLLLMPQNRGSLCNILLNDSHAVSHFSTCLRNLWDCDLYTTGKYHQQSLMDLLMSVDPNESLFAVLYNSSVLVQLWNYLWLRDLNKKRILSILKSKLDPKRLHDLHGMMIAEARSKEYYLVSDRSALEASAREFGQSIGVAYSQLQPSVENQSTEEKNHDSEERAQPEEPNENKNSIVHRMKEVFQSR